MYAAADPTQFTGTIEGGVRSFLMDRDAERIAAETGFDEAKVRAWMRIAQTCLQQAYAGEAESNQAEADQSEALGSNELQR